ncbi:hypothetical protein L195_g018845 [Trifolium pratense]|uniref:Uncharacterized protein n=1 Tax=Trifolium pratense TaxID=57577 RepID=A0A2K3MY02_TRIPR|nr:hypothetical protein L195_g018845 [Trifolium pratense]
MTFKWMPIQLVTDEAKKEIVEYGSYSLISGKTPKRSLAEQVKLKAFYYAAGELGSAQLAELGDRSLCSRAFIYLRTLEPELLF